MFHGPREQVVPFFESMHFFVPERKAVSDFLQEVTSKKDQKVGAPFLFLLPLHTTWLPPAPLLPPPHWVNTIQTFCK